MNAVLKPVDVSCAWAVSGQDAQAALLHAVNDLMLKSAGDTPGDLVSSMARHQLETAGKQLRARLALQACACFGVSRRQAVVWAAAVEILHNATLVHDDLQDGDVERRARPTVWARFGMAQAINAGDYLLMLPFVLLGELPPAARAHLAPLVADFATRIVRGQTDDIEHDVARPIGFDGYLRTCEGKTGALLGLPIVGAAMLGGVDQKEAERLANPFVHLGIMFQLQDDVVDLFGDKGRDQTGSDVYEGKVTSLVISLLARRADLAGTITEILKKPRDEKTPADVDWMRTQYLHSGALADVLARIARIQVQVLNSAVFRTEPKLLAVAQELATMATAPIRHLM